MKYLWRAIRLVVGLVLLSSILAVLAYRYIPVYATPLMFIRTASQISSGEKPRWHHSWVSLDKMSRSMPVAVMASEDSRFLLHHGFDLEAIDKARQYNKTHSRKHGASTITQQCVKNVLLGPGRSWTRKGFEAYFTVLVELFWSKQRIMEVYLNSIEMGDGIYGVQAVAEQHFGKDASNLTRAECALIAATLPNPLVFDSANPSAYVRKRQTRIQHEMKYIPLLPEKGEKVNPKTVKGGIYSRQP